MAIAQLVNGVQHFGLPTNDLERTVAFYEGLGFETVFRAVNNGEPVAFLRLKNLTVETYQNGRAVGKPGATDHVALDVSDVQAAFDALREAGCKLLDSEVQFLPFWERGVRFFTVEGPNGEKIEFSQML